MDPFAPPPPPEDEDLEYPEERPTTREACRKMPRPCPFATCEYSLLVDVRVRRTLPGCDPAEPFVEDMTEHAELTGESCALDIADRGGATLTTVAEVINLTRERIRQVEMKALGWLRKQADRDPELVEAFELIEALGTQTAITDEAPW